MQEEGKNMQETVVAKRRDGKYEEQLGENWIAEYSEDPMNGLFEVEILHHDVSEWFASNFDSLEDAQEAAHEYFNNQVS
ncbi:hypothetical protein [Kaarinaea lacus]